MSVFIPGFFKPPTPPFTKPQPGAAINRNHPLAQGLVHSFPVNEGRGTVIYDNVNRYQSVDYGVDAVHTVRPQWITNQKVMGLYVPRGSVANIAIPQMAFFKDHSNATGNKTRLLQDENYWRGATVHFWGRFTNYASFTSTLVNMAGLTVFETFPVFDVEAQVQNWNFTGGTTINANAPLFTDPSSFFEVVYSFNTDWLRVYTLFHLKGKGELTDTYTMNRRVSGGTNDQIDCSWGELFTRTTNDIVIYAINVWNRALGDAEVKMLVQNPLQMYNFSSIGGIPLLIPDPVHHDPTVTLSANPSSMRSGDSSTLSWTSTFADTLTIDNGVGSVTIPSGSTSVSPTVTTTYTITATNAYGTATATATVTITAARRSPGVLLQRDLTVFSDIGIAALPVSYSAFATIGSVVLVQPSELALLLFITTEAAAVGSRPGVSILLDEITPTLATPFESLVIDAPDPPILPGSQTIYSDRFYVSETQQPAACRHMQAKISWPAEAFANELLSWAIVGAHVEER